MDVQANERWADRLGTTARVVLILVSSILGVFAVGMLLGFSYSMIEHGHIPTKPIIYLIFAAMVGLVAVIVWFLVTVVRSARPKGLSGFDQRYWKMWVIIAVLSLPLGIALAVFGLSDQGNGFSLVLSNDPISPILAILLSAAMTVLLVLAALVYHRTIDDHEERAYLWGSTIGYYFLILAFPLYWLLARGGLVPTLTIGIALLIILFSCIVQAIVWALFKFR